MNRKNRELLKQYQKLVDFVVQENMIKVMESPEFKEYVINELTSFKHFKIPKIKNL